MKKLLFTAFIAVSLMSSAFCAANKEVNYFVSKSFKNDFPDVTKVEWTVASSYSKATFVVNEERTEAFYKPNGEFIGTSHAISLDDLPITAKRSFAKNYINYTVKEAIKFEGIEETAYFISAENENRSVVLKVIDNRISVYTISGKK